MCSIANIKLRLNNDGVETILEIPSNIFEKISTLNDMVQDSFTENSTEDSSNIVDLPPNVINLDIMNLIIEYYQKYFECQNYDDYMIMRWEKDIFDKINYEKLFQTADYLNCKEILYKFNVCALLIQHKKNKGLIHDKDFDASKLRIHLPFNIKYSKHNQIISSYIYLKYYENYFYVESPWLKTTKGVHDKMGAHNLHSTQIQYKYMDLTHPSVYDNDETHRQIDHWFKQFSILDQYIVQTVFEMQNKIYKYSFKKTIVEIQNRYKSFENKYDNTKYTFKIKLNTQLFDHENNGLIEFKNFDELASYIPSNSSVKVIIVPTIWFLNEHFGMYWTIKQVMLEKHIKTTDHPLSSY